MLSRMHRLFRMNLDELVLVLIEYLKPIFCLNREPVNCFNLLFFKLSWGRPKICTLFVFAFYLSVNISSRSGQVEDDDDAPRSI